MGRSRKQNQVIPEKNINKNLLGTINWPASKFSSEVIWYVEKATLLPENVPVVNVRGNHTAHMIMTYPGLDPNRARQLGNFLIDFADKFGGEIK